MKCMGVSQQSNTSGGDINSILLGVIYILKWTSAGHSLDNTEDIVVTGAGRYPAANEFDCL
jgi:hypothetical protein